jgi:acetyltransferase-like isoleucine patch superfamily enzyme
MMQVVVPRPDVNSETATLVSWLAADGERVAAGHPIATVETTKAVLDVAAPAAGWLHHHVSAGAMFRLEQPIATVGDSPVAPRPPEPAQAAAPGAAGGVAATDAARALAERHGIDLATIGKRSLITSRDIEAHLAAASPEPAVMVRAFAPPPPLQTPPGVKRLLLIGAGRAVSQVVETLHAATAAGRPPAAAVAAVDDDPKRWGTVVSGVPVIGAAEAITRGFHDGQFDAAVVTISNSIKARTKFRDLCQGAGVPLANVIDPSCRIAADATVGAGNILLAFCHLGADSTVGDNNFLSAYNSFDHHCVVGSDISTGPGCMASGCVTVGSRVRMGTGIFIEPYLSIGDDCVIASGVTVTAPIRPAHVVKARAHSVTERLR